MCGVKIEAGTRMKSLINLIVTSSELVRTDGKAVVNEPGAFHGHSFQLYQT